MSHPSAARVADSNFRFVLIPADDTQDIQELTEDKSGGITDDALIAYARKYFGEQIAAAARDGAESMDQEMDAEKLKERAMQVRQNIASMDSDKLNAQIQDLDDATVVEMFHRAPLLTTCDITALTIPTPSNRYMAVTMYLNSESSNLIVNKRATQISVACGHSNIIRGDAFIGRALDDEQHEEVWERVDFTVSDADPVAEWCRIAARSGGGGGTGSMNTTIPAPRLSNLIRSAAGAPSAVEEDHVDDSQSMDAMFGTNGVAVIESWGSWTQTKEELELKLIVDQTVMSKQVQVKFSRLAVKVIVSGTTILEGKPFDAIDVDDCTYTLQTTSAGRELCVTLAKAQQGRTWSWAVR